MGNRLDETLVLFEKMPPCGLALTWSSRGVNRGQVSWRQTDRESKQTIRSAAAPAGSCQRTASARYRPAVVEGVAVGSR